MKFLRNIESGNINIKKMGVIKALLVMLLSILLEGLGLVPIEIADRFVVISPYITFVLGALVKYCVIMLLLKWFSDKENEQKPKQLHNRRSFAYVALMIIAFRMIFDNSLSLWISNIPMPDYINEAFEELAISPIILILSVAVIAPIYEEVIFRGILLKGMTKKMNPIIALVVSSLFFALMHMNIPQGINAFLLGIVIGFIYLRTGSIYLSIFAHFVNNFLALSLSSLFILVEGKYAMGIHGLFLVVGFIILFIAGKEYKKSKIESVPDIYKQFIEI
jgi:membrane protease YdiL (CAAX protease family)